MSVQVQESGFDAGAELNWFTEAASGAGAIVSFTGIVRDLDGSLDHMMIEHYPGMTQKALEAIEAEARSRWNLLDSLVIHRYGRLAPDEQIMMVACAGKHRAEAFAAADFLMDYLKSRAPFWKKEVTSKSADWVDSKQSDEDALKRW